MDESQNYYAERKKPPDQKVHILHDSIYMEF